MKINRRDFLRVVGGAAVGSLLMGCGLVDLDAENTALKRESDKYYTAEQPDENGVYWTYQYRQPVWWTNGVRELGTPYAKLAGYNELKGEKPRGTVTLPRTLDGFVVSEVITGAFNPEGKDDLIPTDDYDVETDPYYLTCCDLSEVTELIIPDTIETIDQRAIIGGFQGMGSYTSYNTSLQKIVFTGGRVTLRGDAINYCDKLEEVVGWEYVEYYDMRYIGNMPPTFIHSGFKSLEITDAVVKSKALFWDCPELEKVVFSEGLTEVPAEIFSQDSALTKVYLPDSIQKVGENAFYVWSGANAERLNVYYGGTKEQWSALMKNVESGNDRLRSAKVHYEATVADMDTKKSGWKLF